MLDTVARMMLAGSLLVCIAASIVFYWRRGAGHRIWIAAVFFAALFALLIPRLLDWTGSVSAVIALCCAAGVGFLIAGFAIAVRRETLHENASVREKDVLRRVLRFPDLSLSRGGMPSYGKGQEAALRGTLQLELSGGESLPTDALAMEMYDGYEDWPEEKGMLRGGMAADEETDARATFAYAGWAEHGGDPVIPDVPDGILIERVANGQVETPVVYRASEEEILSDGEGRAEEFAPEAADMAREMNEADQPAVPVPIEKGSLTANEPIRVAIEPEMTAVEPDQTEIKPAEIAADVPIQERETDAVPHAMSADTSLPSIAVETMPQDEGSTAREPEKSRKGDEALLDAAFALSLDHRWSEAADMFFAYRASALDPWMLKQADFERLNALVEASRLREAIDLIFTILECEYDLSAFEREQIVAILDMLEG